jgi:hypothetical protein
VIFDWLYGLDLVILCPLTIVLIAGSAEIGNWFGLRSCRANTDNADVGTLAAAALGLLALLIAFSFSMAESRYDARRHLVLEEANAIDSTANFALMLPEPAQQPILRLLRDYVAARIALVVSSDTAQTQRNIARSLDLQQRLWQQTVTVAAANPPTLTINRFVASLNEMSNLYESRITALRAHVPSVVTVMLTGTAMVALGFTGYNAGLAGARRRLPLFVMSVTVALLIVLIVDLDRPYQGLIQVPVQALIDAAHDIPP